MPSIAQDDQSRSIRTASDHARTPVANDRAVSRRARWLAASCADTGARFVSTISAGPLAPGIAVQAGASVAAGLLRTRRSWISRSRHSRRRYRRVVLDRFTQRLRSYSRRALTGIGKRMPNKPLQQTAKLLTARFARSYLDRLQLNGGRSADTDSWPCLLDLYLARIERRNADSAAPAILRGALLRTVPTASDAAWLVGSARNGTGDERGQQEAS